MLFCFLRTKLFYSPARIIRFPIDIRFRKSIYWGAGFTTGKNCRLSGGNLNKVTLLFGDNVQINDNVHIDAIKSVRIGNNVLIASKVFISDCSHGCYFEKESSDPVISPSDRTLITAPVIIGDRVWIGENVVVMPGVVIGEGAVIGASSVVVHDIPPNSIAVGAPAKVIKHFDFGLKQWVRILKENHETNTN